MADYLRNAEEVQLVKGMLNCLSGFLSFQTMNPTFDGRRFRYVNTMSDDILQLKSRMEEVCIIQLGDVAFKANGGLDIYYATNERISAEEDPTLQRIMNDQSVDDWRDVLADACRRLELLLTDCERLQANTDHEARRRIKSLRNNLQKLQLVSQN
jgi:hypothetical protein